MATTRSLDPNNAPPPAPPTEDPTNPPSMTSPSIDPLKREDSPSRLTSFDSGTPFLEEDPLSTPGAAGAAGRKRKLNNASARGVANLSPEQLAKKRANDRQAQRAIRERTKSHVEALERQVKELSSEKPCRDLQAVMKQNEAVQAENRELRHGLKKAMDTLQPLLAKEGIPPAAAGPAGATGDAPSKPAGLSPPTDGRRFTPSSHRSGTEQSYTESTSGVDTPSSVHSAPTLGVRRESTGSMPSSASFRIAFDYQRHNLAHGLDFGSEERLGFNFLLNGPQQFHKVDTVRDTDHQYRPPPSVNLNSSPKPAPSSPLPDQPAPAFRTPTRNVPPTCTLDTILLDFLHSRQREAAQGISKQRLLGPPYPSVSSLLNPEKSVYSHPISRVFTDILRTFPDISSLPEQVAVLYMMFILMRWQIYSTQENYDRLPDWLTPRPSQLLTPHPAWIDYLPWPRMRDRLVMSYHDYPFENWFIPFTRTLSVNWPYEATDCLLSTGDPDELIINPVFERHFRNLGNWSLGPAFAEAFPGLVETARIKRD